jgi:hypothetical protein
LSTGRHVQLERTLSCGHQVGLITGWHLQGERTLSCGRQVGWSTACQAGIGRRKDAILWPSGKFEYYL